MRIYYARDFYAGTYSFNVNRMETLLDKVTQMIKISAKIFNVVLFIKRIGLTCFSL